MSRSACTRTDRAHPAYFWFGAAAVTLGVAFHLPMYIQAAAMNFHLAGMPVDWRMLSGMVFIGGGTAAAWYGLLPAARTRNELPSEAPQAAAPQAPDSEGQLRWPHWRLLIVLAVALVIDTMKPAALGFTIPGMSQEYGLPRELVALFPFLALTGLTVGSYVWGMIGDQVGRRAGILLSGIMFVGTAICGAMPGFLGNLTMCFFMGLAAGGMLPVTYALLAECLPYEHRGWAMVLVGGIGLVGGFFAASGCAALFEPYFGWRIMWFLNAPTGLALIMLNRLIPESPRFLLMRGRLDEARAIAKQFGARLDVREWSGEPMPSHAVSAGTLLRAPLRGTTLTLNLTAVFWGMINFGLLLWLPAELRARGYGVASSALLFRSALVALPTMFIVAWLYANWSSKWTLFVLIAMTAVGLAGFSLIDTGVPLVHDHLLVLFSFLMVGVNGIIAVLLPYSAENYPVLVRGRGTGLVAGSSKFGGLAAQAITVASLVPGLVAAAVALAFPVAVTAAMVAHYGRETRNRRLEDFDR
jgi:MFS transporter, putative metabolite:H+ symporter